MGEMWKPVECVNYEADSEVKNWGRQHLLEFLLGLMFKALNYLQFNIFLSKM